MTTLYSRQRNPNSHSAGLTTLAIVAAVGLLSSGCVSTTLTSGANLAKAGQAAASQMQQNVTLSQNTVLSLKKAVAFNDGFNNGIGNTNSEAFLSHITSIQSKLAKYGDWLGSLSAAYSALGDLAAYDATGSFTSSITSLASDTTNLANVIGSPINIPPEATAGVKAVGGFIVGQAQATKVKRASKSIEAILTNVIAILDEPSTKGKLIAAHEKVAGQIDDCAVALFSNGLGSYSAVVDDLGAPLGIKSGPNTDDIVKKNDRLLAGIRNVAVELANQQISSQEAAYNQSLSALKALVPQHQRLSKGIPLNLETVNIITTQLQALASAFPKPTK